MVVSTMQLVILAEYENELDKKKGGVFKAGLLTLKTVPF